MQTDPTDTNATPAGDSTLPAPAAPQAASDPAKANPTPPTAATQASPDGTQTDSADKASPKKPSTRFDPARPIRTARLVMQKANGNPDPSVVAAASDTEAAIALISQSADAVAVSVRARTAAEVASVPSGVGLTLSLKKVEALARVAPGGATMVRSCRSRYPWVASQRILKRLGSDDLGIPASFIEDLQDAQNAAAPLRARVDQAVDARALAESQYGVAKAQLSQAVSLLRNAIERTRLQNRGARSRSRKRMQGPAPAPSVSVH